MTLVQLETLLAVVESGSFSKAAEILNMTQSAVTHNIKNLETELGLQLVVRSRSGVTLTHFGERIVQHARQVHLYSRCIHEEANALRGVHKGSIRVGIISSVFATFISGFIKDFDATFPNVQLVLFEGTRDEVVTWVHNGVVDVAFMSICDDMNDPIKTIPLMRDYMSVLVPVTHPLAGQTSITMDEFAELPLIFPKTDSDNFLENFFNERGITIDIRFTVRDTATILSMIGQGLGVTLLPHTSIPHGLLNISVLNPTFKPYRVVGLGLPNQVQTSPLVEVFVKHAESYVSQNEILNDTQTNSDERLPLEQL